MPKQLQSRYHLTISSPYSFVMLSSDSKNSAQQSPVSVFDFSAIINLDQDDSGTLQVPSMICQGVPLSLHSVTDSITASFTDDSDYHSSVSSLHPEEEATPKKRFVFAQYWEKTGEQPIQLKRHPYSLPAPNSRTDQEHVESYEKPRLPAHDIESDDHAPKRSPERRSIFGNQGPRISYSERSLPLRVPPSTSTLKMTRKARSASALLDRPPSILRKDCNSRPRRHSSSSVSFDDKIDVVLFQPPLELWSNGDWSKLFAS
jgi:hypothetical protein